MPIKPLRVRRLPSMKHMRQLAYTIASQQVDIECLNDEKDIYGVRFQEKILKPVTEEQAKKIRDFIVDGYTAGIIGIFSEE